MFLICNFVSHMIKISNYTKLSFLGGLISRIPTINRQLGITQVCF